jgi:Putative Flp pilus-assembly TadE/G-like
MNSLVPHRFQSREGERGQTLLLVVICIAVLIGMAALAIDIATLYTAHNETRRAAEAAALAGAHAIASSGVTSGWLTQAQACSGNIGSPGLAEDRALALVAQNAVAGGAATLQATTCNFAVPTNPRFTVMVQRTGLPTFFGRIFGSVLGTATASATAEAYNPSGTTGPPIQVGSVKPWAIPNCDPNNGAGNPACTTTGPPSQSGGYFIDPNSNYAVANPSTVISNLVDLNEATMGSTNTGSPINPGSIPVINFLAVDVPISAATASCPSPSRISCSGNGLVLDPSNPGFNETIACANSHLLSCGQILNVDPNSGTNPSNPGHIHGEQAALCLIHAGGMGKNQGQDQFCNNVSSPSCPSGSPINIDGGSNNPDPGLAGTNNISRSDSVVTVPIYCTGPGCTTNPLTIIGFLQLEIDEVRNVAGGPYPLRARVMNVVGCGSTSGSNPVSGGGVSPIPVRLVQ